MGWWYRGSALGRTYPACAGPVLATTLSTSSRARRSVQWSRSCAEPRPPSTERAASIVDDLPTRLMPWRTASVRTWARLAGPPAYSIAARRPGASEKLNRLVKKSSLSSAFGSNKAGRCWDTGAVISHADLHARLQQRAQVLQHGGKPPLTSQSSSSPSWGGMAVIEGTSGLMRYQVDAALQHGRACIVRPHAPSEWRPLISTGE